MAPCLLVTKSSPPSGGLRKKWQLRTGITTSMATLACVPEEVVSCFLFPVFLLASYLVVPSTWASLCALPPSRAFTCTLVISSSPQHPFVRS